MESLLGVLAGNNYARGKKWSILLLIFSASSLLVATYSNFGYLIAMGQGPIVPRVPQFLIILPIIGVLFSLVKVNIESRKSKLIFWGLSLPIGLFCILSALQSHSLSLISPIVLLMLYTRNGYFGQVSTWFFLVIFASGWLLNSYIYFGWDSTTLRKSIAVAFISINLLPLSWLMILSVLEIKRFSLLMNHQTQA